jgi:DNA mismatch repair protein MutS2
MEAAQILEFEALKELVGRWVRSPMGRSGLSEVQPSSDRAVIAAALTEVAEAIDYLRSASAPQPAARGSAIRLHFDDIADPAPALARLRIEGATLEGREIFELGELLERASEVRANLRSVAERFPRLSAIAGGIEDFRDTVRVFRGKILPDGSLADDASPLLAQLRRDAERQQKRIQDSLDRFLRMHKEDRTLQEEFVTIRNERLVVPVIAGQQGKIEGVIHGASASGHTLFLEPLETIELNNELVRLHEEELREIHRILREFTCRLRERAPAVEAAANALGRLDLLFGEAQFGIEFKCTVPRLGDRLILNAARHPILEDLLRAQRRSIVPTSLTLDADHRTLLISGPNTGGKTVALKTVGLCALMAHAGMPVPAADAEFPVFDQVLADIGDHQSIQESLSTFSAHVAAVRGMLELATARSLVLLDELGRATDPEEGGALGVAILETFRLSGAFTIASTHLLALKIYGATTPGVVNASMGFDENTLEPTYVLRVGAPGKSAGIDIASRLGLPPDLIERARAGMGSQERDIARFLVELSERLDRVAAREREVEVGKAAFERDLRRQYDAKIAELEQRSAALTRAFEERARETLAELGSKAAARAQQKIAKTRREYREQVDALAEKPKPAPIPKLVEGAQVRLRGVRQPAIVRRVTADGRLEVEAGVLKMRVGENDVEEVLGMAEKTGPKRSVTFTQGPSWDDSYREINVIGQRAEEACDQVDRFVDRAALAQVEKVRIVHGHGMGILKRAIADLLRQNLHVAKFYEASPNEGGAGATIAELKS